MTSVHNVHTNNGEGEFSLPPNISFGTLVEARSKRMPSLHPEWVFEVGRYSRNHPTERYVKNMAKTRF